MHLRLAAELHAREPGSSKLSSAPVECLPRPAQGCHRPTHPALHADTNSFTRHCMPTPIRSPGIACRHQFVHKALHADCPGSPSPQAIAVVVAHNISAGEFVAQVCLLLLCLAWAGHSWRVLATAGVPCWFAHHAAAPIPDRVVSAAPLAPRCPTVALHARPHAACLSASHRRSSLPLHRCLTSHRSSLGRTSRLSAAPRSCAKWQSGLTLSWRQVGMCWLLVWFASRHAGATAFDFQGPHLLVETRSGMFDPAAGAHSAAMDDGGPRGPHLPAGGQMRSSQVPASCTACFAYSVLLASNLCAGTSPSLLPPHQTHRYSSVPMCAAGPGFPGGRRGARLPALWRIRHEHGGVRRTQPGLEAGGGAAGARGAGPAGHIHRWGTGGVARKCSRCRGRGD